MHVKSKLIFVLAVMMFVLFAALIFRAPIARSALHLGNAFFGGALPYSLTLADLSYQGALFLDPGVPDVWHQRARIAFLKGDFTDALSKMEEQFKLHGDELMAAYYIRGLIHGYNKEYADAEKDFATFLEWDPTSWAANNDLAWIYFVQGKFKEAKAQAEIGLVHNSQNPWLHMMHAMSRFNLGERGGVIEELELARTEAAGLTEENWSRAYPGNDPKIAGYGLEAFREAIETNIEVVNKALLSP